MSAIGNIRRGRAPRHGAAVRRRAAALAVLALLSPAVATVTSGPAGAVSRCDSDVELVVARGTTEPGYLGAAVGDPLAAALREVLGDPTVSTYPVNYPANLLDPLSIGRGSVDLVRHIVDQAALCPAQRFAVAGYSQGAVVVRASLGNDVASAIPGTVRLPAELAGRVAVVLLFGDPFSLAHLALPGPWRTGSWCSGGDPVCQFGGWQWAAHTTYGDAVAAAARFTAAGL